jgi:PEP-CTERM motif
MKLLKAVFVLGVVLLSSSTVFASIVSPNRGPTGSPTLLPFESFEGTTDFTVVNGVVVAVSITFPDAPNNFCGISNAFLDGGGPVDNGDGTDTCNYAAFTGTNNDPSDFNESVKRMELDCFLTNLGVIRDADDCGGVPSGTSNSDLVFVVPEGLEVTADSTITGTPEPASVALLLAGMVSLGFVRRRRSLLA